MMSPHGGVTATAGVGPEAAGSWVAPGYEPVRAEFASMLALDEFFSAQLAVYVDGVTVVDLAGGNDLAPTSITGVFSVTKGVAAIVVGLLIRRGLLDGDRPVVHYWPEFAPHGKDRVLVRELLSHQAGLIGVDGGLTTGDLIDSEDAADRLAAMRPVWRPGAMFGYHGLTLGILMEELVRRLTGDRLQAIFEREIRAPRGLDFYLGLPEQLEHRYQRVLPVPVAKVDASVQAGVEVPGDGLAELMYNVSKPGETLLTGPASPNERAIRATGPAAVGGVGTARGLAGVYAAAIGQLGGRPALLDPGTADAMSQQQVWGRDRLLGVDMCFGMVFMKPQPRMDFGSYRAFGHDGAGGALGFADPRYKMGFGYIPQPMQPPGGADPKGVRLAQIVRACAARAQRGADA